MFLNFDEEVFQACKTSHYENLDFIREIMLELKMIPESPLCPSCAFPTSLNKDNSRPFLARYWCGRCVKRYCARNFSAFTFSRLKSREILQILALFVSEQSVTEIIAKTELSSHTVQSVISFIRKSIFCYIERIRQPIGNNSIVEIDETLIAKKRKYNRGRIVTQQWLFGAIERDGGRLFLKTVESRDKRTLGQLIKNFIVDSSTVYSDQWASYISFFAEEGGYNHSSVNHSKNFVNPEDSSVHTQTIECIWGKLKEWLRRKHLNNREYLEEYLAEFIWRRENKALSKSALMKELVSILNCNE